MMGDRLTTDIQMGIDARMFTALVLTSETTREVLAESHINPKWQLERIDELLHIEGWIRLGWHYDR